MSTTLLCCTENRVPQDIWNAVTKTVKKNAPDVPIICVSHEPVEFGHNVVIGKHPRSWLTLYRQLLTGLRLVETENVTIVEHDCLYSPEHLCWEPPRDDTFFYNENVLLAQWSIENHPELNGMYSRFWKERLALSQLICNTELYRETLELRMDIIDGDRAIAKSIANIYEPGYSRIKKKLASVQKWAASGRPVYLKGMLENVLELEKYETFETSIPNLDIRHDGNFTGPRRGRKRRWELPYWGKLADIIEGST